VVAFVEVTGPVSFQRQIQGGGVSNTSCSCPRRLRGPRTSDSYVKKYWATGQGRLVEVAKVASDPVSTMKDALSTGPLSAPECGHCKFAMVDGFERLEERWLGMMGKSSVKV
jgi:hypothetical protein